MRMLRHCALRRTAPLALLALTGTLLSAPTALAVARAASTPSPAHAANAGALTTTQALAQATKTGKQVPIPAQTTPTSTLAANPNGTLSLTENALPVRKLVNGTWQPLDATLVKNADGSISPRLANGPLRLSAGGSGPLATLISGTHNLKITLPVTLPTPTLSGPSATYHDVAPGIDLVVTATTLGSVSDVLVVKNAAAASSPALTRLLTADVSGTGLTVTADRDGNLTAASRNGTPVFSANAPSLWDSAAATPRTGVKALASPGALPTSNASAPGPGAHTGKLTAHLTGHSLTLTPDKNVLAGAHTIYPAYLDPTWGPVSKTAWSTVAAAYPYPSQYWNKSVESAGYMAVGWTSDLIAIRTLINFSIPTSTLSGATISSAMFYAWNTYSGGCPNSGENQTVDVDAPSATLSSSSAYWNNWNGSQVGGTIGSKSFSYGYSSSGIGGPSSCTTGGAPIGIGLNPTTFTNDVSSGKTTQTLALVAENQSDIWGWKLFDPSSAKLTITYNHAPVITSLASDTSTDCSATSPGLLGKGNVNLTAGVYDADGDSLTAYYGLYNKTETVEYNPASTTGGTTTTKSAVPATSGTKATLVVPQAFFTGLNITTPTTFAWTVYDYDGTTNSVQTSTCDFTYDPSSPGQPTITDASGTDCPPGNPAQTYKIGAPATFTLSDGNTNGGTVGGYTYQLNNAAPITVTVPAGTASPYSAAITLKPTRGTNLLTVTALSSGGNLGLNQTCTFQATTTSSSDHDLTGDAQPDLLTVGTTTAPMAPGLWLAPGANTTGAVSTTPTDIGINGDGVIGDNKASDFTGTQAISGNFTGRGLQDILTYHPTGTRAGEADIYDAPGDGSPLLTQYADNEHTITHGLLVDNNGDYTPLQLANAYNAASSGLAYPDLIGISGDDGNGYDLTYYPNGDSGGSTAYGRGYSIGSYDSNTLTFTAIPTPTGGTDWKNWTLATAQTNGNTWIFLWNTGATGAKPLYLWQNFTVNGYSEFSNTAVACTAAKGPDICTATGFTQYQLSANWTPGTLQTLQAADFDNDTAPDLLNPTDKIPDLWAVTTTGTVTPYTVSGLNTTTPTVTAGTTQQLTTATHTWALNDNTNDSNGHPTAADNTTATPLSLTSSTGTTWNTGDQFNPDIKLDGTTGHLATASNAVTLTGSFTVSTWVNPTALGGAVLSQDGTADSGFTLTPTASGWQFALNTGAGTAWAFDTITGGSVQLGAWSHLTAAYDANSHVMSLYVDDVYVANGTHTPPSTGATGPFQIGQDLNTGSPGAHFAGQVAQVQVWNGAALAPARPYAPGAYHQALTPTRILDTRTTNNVQNSNNPPSTPVPAGGTVVLQIIGDTVTTAAGASTQIPTSATAVALDLTVTDATATGFLTAYPDGTQQPLTSTTNYAPTGSTTGFQIVPLGLDGKIALYNGSSGTADLIVDATGYFTTDSTLAGDQTYHPLTASRALDTRTSIANTTGLTGTGPVPAGTTFTLQITGHNGVPAGASAVALNLTTTAETGNGYLMAYATGNPPAKATALTYTTSTVANLGADIPLSTSGSNTGSINIYNYGAATDIIADIQGYYTTDATGELYHATAPTRLVDTRNDLGGGPGSHAGPLSANATYTLSQSDTTQITTATQPTLALNLTATQGTNPGYLTAYPTGTTQPAVSNLDYNTNQSIGNLALVTVGTGTNAGQVAITNTNSGTVQLVIDCSGYFTTS